jgi:DNA-binding PadR family transcriptional regulator
MSMPGISDTVTNAELAILGLVAENRKYGYQIEQDIDRRGIREWTDIGFSSIYYILNKLEKSAWLESSHEPGGDRPARKMYQMTQAGYGVYRSAVLQRLAHPRPHSGDFDLALANLPAVSTAEAVDAIRIYARNLAEKIKAISSKWQAERSSGIPPHAQLLFDHSLNAMQHDLDWVNKFLQTRTDSI